MRLPSGPSSSPPATLSPGPLSLVPGEGEFEAQLESPQGKMTLSPGAVLVYDLVISCNLLVLNSEEAIVQRGKCAEIKRLVLSR